MSNLFDVVSTMLRHASQNGASSLPAFRRDGVHFLGAIDRDGPDALPGLLRDRRVAHARRDESCAQPGARRIRAGRSCSADTGTPKPSRRRASRTGAEHDALLKVRVPANETVSTHHSVKRRFVLGVLALIGVIAIALLVLGLLNVHVVTDHFRIH
jgi:hypothetical protein